MLAYALYAAFTGAFVVVAALGHVLVLTALYPEIFGRHEPAQADLAERHPPKPA